MGNTLLPAAKPQAPSKPPVTTVTPGKVKEIQPVQAPKTTT